MYTYLLCIKTFKYLKTIPSLSAPLSSLFFRFTQTQWPFQDYMDENYLKLFACSFQPTTPESIGLFGIRLFGLNAIPCSSRSSCFNHNTRCLLFISVIPYQRFPPPPLLGYCYCTTAADSEQNLRAKGPSISSNALFFHPPDNAGRTAPDEPAP